MEFPEKLYIENRIHPYSYLTACKDIMRDDDIEYVRTDAFIEKAENYLRNKCQRFILTEIDIEDFVKFMKGE